MRSSEYISDKIDNPDDKIFTYRERIIVFIKTIQDENGH